MTETTDTSWAEGLNERHRAFCEAYAAHDGNGTEAARKCGYKHPEVQASRLLSLDKIKDALEKLRSKTTSAAIATREARQSFWTEIMSDPELRMADRLKASELLGKSQADFIERKEITGANGAPLQAEVRIKFVDA